MKIGFIADAHLGYTRTRKLNEYGVNVREQDVYDAALLAMDNLLDNKVDVIVDLGDLADTPSPKKRTVSRLVTLIGEANYRGVPFYSIEGNHTLTRSNTDIPLLQLLAGLCEDFYPILEPAFIEELGMLAIPYGSAESARRGLSLLDKHDVKFIGGHWAASDVPFSGDHILVSELPYQIPTFLGHFHNRTYEEDRNPIYVGATERFAWGQHNNPTGICIYDTDTQEIKFIDHPVREWLDLRATADDYLDVLDTDLEDKIVRLKVDADPLTFNRLDRNLAYKKAQAAIEFTFTRDNISDNTPATVLNRQTNEVVRLEESWKDFMQRQGDIPTKIKKSIEERGLRLLGAT